MEISRIYEGLRDQAGLLTGMEKQVEDLLATNAKNLQNINCLELTSNRKAYFDNQHRAFNVLFEAITDLKVMNSYTLLELECQLRGDEPRKDTGFQTA